MTNAVQRLQFDLMKKATFNFFDGEQVVRTLRQHESLWVAALMDHASLIKLRDLADGDWHVDTLYILAAEGKEDALERLARTWSADDVEWIGGRAATGILGLPISDDRPRMILCLWWD